MNQETVALIDKLATKLGTTSDYLWGVLIKQAPISGVVDVIQNLLVISFVYLLIRCALWVRHKDATDKRGDWGWLYMPVGIASFVAAIAVLICVSYLQITVAAFLNPEYWALHEIMGAIRK